MNEADLVKSFGAFFAIMNPFVNLPIFLALTSAYTVQQQRTLALKISLFSFLMCIVILVGGQQIISFFGITVNEFRIAGGMVLAHIAWTMLNGEQDTTHHGTSDEQSQMADLNSLAFYPMTFPMIVGPGTIATIIISTGVTTGNGGLLNVGVVIAAVLLVLFFVLYFASFFGKVMTATMKVIMTRLMGMILLAIAVEMVADGIKAVLPGLA